MTLAQKTAFRDAAEAAYLAAYKAKSYNINLGGTARTLARQELKTLKEDFLYWQREVDKADGTASGITTKFGTAQ